MRHSLRILCVCAALLGGPAAQAYYVSGGRIYDDQAKRITIQGVNWFGFETETRVVHGLWARNLGDMLDQMKAIGFNAVRVPFCPAVLNGAATSSIGAARRGALGQR
jgi:endoglucanase